MGAVYQAEDTKLKRTVALKFFPAAVDPVRLLREAPLAASLHHPNVCTVFEVDEEHRDVNSGNVMVTGRGQAKVTDCGE